MSRVLFHVQHLLGVGHLMRTLAIARACAGRGLAVTVASGGAPVAGADADGVDLAQLPPLRAGDEAFATLVDNAGRPIDDAWRARRRDALLELFARIRPRVVVVEAFPFGRRALRFELLPLIEAARGASPRPRIVSSVRDVLTERKPERTAEAAAWAQRLIDAVLVHGDPEVIAFGESFPAAAAIADRLVYTGYVVGAGAAGGAAGAAGRGEVVVSAGGGAVGATLLRTALAARPLSAAAAGRRWRLIGGANLDEAAFAALAGAAPSGVVVDRARGDLALILANCAASVSQAGYNTMLDIVRARARAVVVPFARGRQTEQALRAARFERLGLVRCLAEAEATPARLAAAVDAAVAAPRPAAGTMRMDGADESAARIAAWAE